MRFVVALLSTTPHCGELPVTELTAIPPVLGEAAVMAALGGAVVMATSMWTAA
eukprot:CAMPEP_0115128642 /NCGR_PEP_ID=MMETSP0227-20121206/51268_1 /TAXON_ID=89957 /ORGANISM="Polarella glacialis, Strain CCMP 1383" /LENGTH=52 /DNA_ID=CAMNT_0002533261 /DNA_START=72 /DNA_END=226 /DNA_ORIENTATION=-